MAGRSENIFHTWRFNKDFLGREGKQNTLNEIQTILSLSQRLLFAGWKNHQKFEVPIVEALELISYKASLGMGFLLHKPYIQPT